MGCASPPSVAAPCVCVQDRVGSTRNPPNTTTITISNAIIRSRYTSGPSFIQEASPLTFGPEHLTGMIELKGRIEAKKYTERSALVPFKLTRALGVAQALSCRHERPARFRFAVGLIRGLYR